MNKKECKNYILGQINFMSDRIDGERYRPASLNKRECKGFDIEKFIKELEKDGIYQIGYKNDYILFSIYQDATEKLEEWKEERRKLEEKRLISLTIEEKKQEDRGFYDRFTLTQRQINMAIVRDKLKDYMPCRVWNLDLY